MSSARLGSPGWRTRRPQLGAPLSGLCSGLALIPALAAIIAAVLAARSVHKARTTETELEKLRLLERRVVERKYETYKPMIDMLSEMLSGAAGRCLRPSC